MLEIHHLGKSFSGVSILDEVDLTISKNEIVFVLGRSGVGKSVLLRLIVGLISLDEGEVILNGEKVDFQDRKALLKLRSQVGLVFQKPALLDHLTISDNLCFGMKEKPADFKDKVQRIGLSEEDLGKDVQEASFGMQKKASVLRVLLRNPEFILFDEPTTGLDPISTEAMNQLMLTAVRESGAGALVVSHDMESALRYADRLLLIDKGHIIFNGTAAQLRNSTHPIARAFLAWNKNEEIKK